MSGESPRAEAGWSLVVDPGSEGLRLDIFLCTRIARLSRARAARLMVVDLDDPERVLKKSSTVRAGMRLWARRPIPDADVEPPTPTVLHIDGDLLVLDKPAGLAVHPTASRFRGTVTTWLAERAALTGAPAAEPVHRLDVETSGVLLCARHGIAARRLKAAFAAEAMHKTYRAVVEGQPPDRWTCTLPLGFDAGSAVRLKMGAGDQAAETGFVTVARGRRRALVEARPTTGRQHQIRVHLAHGGFPVVGDKLYGPDEALFLAQLDRPLTGAELARLGHVRHALHAWRLAFEWRGREVVFEAPWPMELAALLDR
ncbi:MAG: RluA family pseudouridine synthase [Myxococcales bacterium]|nr:RluA family pseudouridine synthase [Myxococcales bacterium]